MAEKLRSGAGASAMRFLRGGEMAAAGEQPNFHAGGAGGGDAKRAVLHHQAPRRIDAHALRRQQKQIRRRLCPRYHRHGVDALAEVPRQAGNAQRFPYALRCAAGGRAIGNGKRVENLDDARHGGQLLREAADQGGAIVAFEAGRQRCAVLRGDLSGNDRIGMADEMLQHMALV